MPGTGDLFQQCRRIPLKRFQLGGLIFLLFLTYVFPHFLTGVLWGFYASIMFFLYVCVSDPVKPQKSRPTEHDKLLEQLRGRCECDDRQDTIYRGWINIFEGFYDPHKFNIDSVQTVLIRLDGKQLRISKPERVLLKHGIIDDPSLSGNEPPIIDQHIFDLTNAKVVLRPHRLAPRRWFSRRYPICIKFLDDKDDPETAINPRAPSSGSIHPHKSFASNETKSRAPSEDKYRAQKLCRRATIDVGNKVIDFNHGSNAPSDDDLFLPRSASDDQSKTRKTSSLMSRFRKSHPAKERRNIKVIYLFARTAREKERWFHLLRKATFKDTDHRDKHKEDADRKLSVDSKQPLTDHSSMYYYLYITHALNFKKHLRDTLQIQILSNVDQNGVVLMDLGRCIWKDPTECADQGLVRITNLLASRLYYDFCRDKQWCARIKDKIQNKLSSIHLPHYVEKLELSDFEIGTAIPLIERICEPVVNDWGIWIDFKLKYDGMIKLVLETRVNFVGMKERRDSNEHDSNSGSDTKGRKSRRYTRFSDEEVPESPESSANENYGAKVKPNRKNKKKVGKRMLNMLNKITNSQPFQKVTEFKPVRKMMEDFSTKRLILHVEIQQLEGIVTLNMPPPPSDRFWYAFRQTPQMSIKVVPQIGDRTVAFSMLSEWIEKKLVQLLERNLVLPNMDDVRVPFTNSSELMQGLSE